MEAPCFSSVSRCAANAEIRIEFRIAIVSRLHRDRNSGLGGFHCKTWEFGSPDSGFEFRIAIVSRYDRDTEFILCSGLACLEFDAPEVVTPFSSRRGFCRVFVAGRFGRRFFRHKLQNDPIRPHCAISSSFGDSGCGGARLLRILIAAEACVRHLLKLKLARVACAAQEHHPIEQECLIQWQ